MLKKTFFIVIMQAVMALTQSFNQFVVNVNIAPPERREVLVDSFLHAVSSFPYCENDTLVHFLYYGEATSVTVPGDANNWDINSYHMWKLSTTKLWYLTKSFEADARLDYKFVINGQKWILDPRNPLQMTGGYGPNSELRMPRYLPPEEIIYNEAIPHGTIKDSTIYSAILNSSRRIKVYLPPGYVSSSSRYPMVLVHDGFEYISLAKMPIILDNLIAQRRIEPIVAVFLPPVERTAEYAGSKQSSFAEFIVKELLPHLEAHYRLENSPHRRLTIGASYGGNISLYLGFYHADVFGKIAAQSTYIQPSLDADFRTQEKKAIELYLDLGTYDIPLLIPMVRQFVPVLQQKGYSFRYQEFHEGHSWGNWRAHVDDILEYFFPQSNQGVGENLPQPLLFWLGQNYPNPFNPCTIIPFSLRQNGRITLSVFDTLGRKVATILEQDLSAGNYKVRFNGEGLPSGLYFYCLCQANRVDARPMFYLR